MSGLRSRNKGKQGEREAAELLRSMGIDARRSQQFSGQGETADLITELDGLHIEVKRYAKISATKFMQQAKEDAGNGLPIVIMREDRGEWLIMLEATRLQDFARLVSEHLKT